MNIDRQKIGSIHVGAEEIGKLLDRNWSVVLKLFGALFSGDPFPDVGQWILAVSWLLFFLIVSMPALVKLLPFLTERRVQMELVPFLKCFLPDKELPWHGGEPTADQVDNLAHRFACNSFWPNGDWQAKVLFGFSFFVFLIILFPLFSSFTFFIALALMAVALTTVFLFLLRLPLWWVNPKLIKRKRAAKKAD